MQVQLIHPPVYVNPRSLTALRPSPPLGLAYVAAALERAGHAVSVIDALAEAPEQTVQEGRVTRLGLSPEQIVARIDPDTRALGMTNMWSFAWPVVRELIRQIKTARPDIVLVCGGEHFSAMPELSMSTAPIDYIVFGEGEATAVELFAAIEAGLDGEPFDPRAMLGIAWRDGDDIVINPRRARIKDIDGVPWPAWHLFDLDTYNAHDMKSGIDYGYMVPTMATRGCPYQCTYCSSPSMWTTRWYTRDPADVADEIEFYVKTYGANNFPLQDLTAIIRKQWIVDFCKELLRRKLDIRWQLPSGTRCEVVDDEVTPLLYESGCRTLCYAPESGSDETRKRILKKMKRSALFDAISAAVRQRINLTVFFVHGLPHDEERHVRENLRFVRDLARLGVEDIAVGYFFPIPSTRLYDELVALGRISDEDEVLMTPIFVQEGLMTAERNYSLHLPAWKLSMYKWLMLANFYPLAFVTHPERVLRLARNFFKGREESKMDSFLQISLKQVRTRVARMFGRTRAAAS